MKINRNLLCLFLIFFIASACYKTVLIVPPPKGPSPDILSIYYWNVTIDSNANYTFYIPQITQTTIDSDEVGVYFRSPLVVLDTWYPLPYYFNLDRLGSSITVSSLQVGAATVTNSGIKSASADYRFDIALGH
jgi:hypothetical protein